MTFKEKLVKLRKLKGITQDEFASAVGVSRQAVYKWESGQSYPEAAKLLEIKALFNISIDDLLDDSFEVVLPEKQKKRVSAVKLRTISEALEKEEIKEVETEPVIVVAEAPLTTEVSVEAVAEEQKAVPVADEKEEPVKRGFFSRIFGGR